MMHGTKGTCETKRWVTRRDPRRSGSKQKIRVRWKKPSEVQIDIMPKYGSRYARGNQKEPGEKNNKKKKKQARKKQQRERKKRSRDTYHRRTRGQDLRAFTTNCKSRKVMTVHALLLYIYTYLSNPLFLSRFLTSRDTPTQNARGH